MSRNARCKLVFAVALGTLFHACGLFYVYTIRLRVHMTSSCAPKPFNTTVPLLAAFSAFIPTRTAPECVVEKRYRRNPFLGYVTTEFTVRLSIVGNKREIPRARKTKEKGTTQGSRSYLRYIEAQSSMLSKCDRKRRAEAQSARCARRRPNYSRLSNNSLLTDTGA